MSLQTFIKEYDGTKHNDVDPTSLFNTMKSKMIARFKIEFIMELLGRVLHETKTLQAGQAERELDYMKDVHVRQMGEDAERQRPTGFRQLES